jgi:hypothetical protein
MAPLRLGFWTAYRRIYVEDGLARGQSRAMLAAKLGVTVRQLNMAIYNHRLKPRRVEDPVDG